MLNINKVKNETLHKLTCEEIGTLGLLNYGVITYHGELKSRKQNFKTEKVNDWQTNFIGTKHNRLEFIKIQQTSEGTDYAMRLYDTELETYNVNISPLAGIDFFK